MAPRLSKRDGELIDQIFAENPAADANQVADLFHTTYKTVSERRRKLFNRIRTGVDLRKRPGPKKASHRARREDAVMSTPPSFPSSSLHASLQQPRPQLQLQLQPIMSTLPPPRRIVTSNLPLPRRYAGVKDAEPAVQVVSEDIEPVPELNGGAARGTVFTHDVVPTSNAGLDITPQEIAGGGIVIPRGANIRFNDIGPGERVPMHRTSTTDYDIFIIGSVVLLTPDEAYDPQSGKGKLLETICKPGDVVVQRGALHAWENRSTEWVRFLSILLGAEPTSVEVEGEFDGRGPVTKELADCFDV